MTPEQIGNEYSTGIKDLMSKYGPMALWRDAPRDEVIYITERSRARFILIGNPGDSTALRRNGIPARLIEELGGEVVLVPKQKRSDKYSKALSWCDENIMRQVSVNDIAEAGDFSYPTALKLVADRPDLFRKVKRGIYEIRDVEAERKADKK
jgi:hypothetical protein